jgi:hypothetical protein
MLWLSIGIMLGIWLDQTFTIPPLQHYFEEKLRDFRKNLKRS